MDLHAKEVSQVAMSECNIVSVAIDYRPTYMNIRNDIQGTHQLLGLFKIVTSFHPYHCLH